MLFQAIPLAFSGGLAVLSILCAVPIYIMAKISSRGGLVIYIVVAFLLMLLNLHICVLFLLTNGALGYTLGIWSNYYRDKLCPALISGIVLTITLSVLSFVLGLPINFIEITNIVFLQIIFYFLIATVYSIVYLNLAQLIYKLLNRYYYLDDEFDV